MGGVMRYYVEVRCQVYTLFTNSYQTMKEVGEALGAVLSHLEAGYDATALRITIEKRPG